MNTDSLRYRVWYNSRYDNKGWRMADVCSLHINKNKVIIPKPPFGNISIDLDHNAILENCSGLKDKNGKLIYAGDVVVEPSGDKLTVIYKNGAFMLECDGVPAALLCEALCPEIIGNIHEMEEKDV